MKIKWEIRSFLFVTYKIWWKLVYAERIRSVVKRMKLIKLGSKPEGKFYIIVWDV